MGIYQPQLMAVTVLQGWLGLNTWQKHSVSSCKADIVSMFPDDMFHVQLFCNILQYFAIFCHIFHVCPWISFSRNCFSVRAFCHVETRPQIRIWFLSSTLNPCLRILYIHRIFPYIPYIFCSGSFFGAKDETIEADHIGGWSSCWDDLHD